MSVVYWYFPFDSTKSRQQLATWGKASSSSIWVMLRNSPQPVKFNIWRHFTLKMTSIPGSLSRLGPKYRQSGIRFLNVVKLYWLLSMCRPLFEWMFSTGHDWGQFEILKVFDPAWGYFKTFFFLVILLTLDCFSSCFSNVTKWEQAHNKGMDFGAIPQVVSWLKWKPFTARTFFFFLFLFWSLSSLGKMCLTTNSDGNCTPVAAFHRFSAQDIAKSTRCLLHLLQLPQLD